MSAIHFAERKWSGTAENYHTPFVWLEAIYFFDAVREILVKFENLDYYFSADEIIKPIEDIWEEYTQ